MNETINILIINQHFADFMGGSENQSHLIASNLNTDKFNVFYFAVDGFQDNYDVSYTVIPSKLNTFKLISVIVKNKIDIIYWRFGRKKLLMCTLICKLFHVKFIFGVSAPTDLSFFAKVYHSKKASWDFVIYLFKRLLVDIPHIINRISFGLIDVFILQLHNQTRFIKKRSFTIIPNSINNYKPIEKFSWKNAYIIWVANLKKVKHPEIFIEMANKFKDKKYLGGGIDFLMFGDIQSKKYEFVADPKNLPSNCFYLGKQNINVVNSAIKNSVFLVHTCEPEGMPNVFLQAWSAGKATVSLNYDPDEMITKNQLGYYSKSVDNLIHSIYTILNNPSKREEFETNALNICKQFTIENNIEKLERAILSIYKNQTLSSGQTI